MLLEDEPSRIGLIRDEVIKHVQNNGQDPRYAESSSKAVVSIKTDRQTPYDVYLQTLDEVWMAYFTMWDALARQQGAQSYRAYRDALGPDEENMIREEIPAQISIAEPDQGDGSS